MRFFDVSLHLNGYRINEAKNALKEILSKNELEFNTFLNTQKEEIVSYHLTNNSFYKSLLKNGYNGSWDSIPIMTKADLQKPLSNRLSKGFTTKNVYVNKTSGSSGDPFIFAKDKWAHALTWAEIMNRFSWYNIDFNQSFQARFYGIPLDFIGNKKERVKDVFANRYRFSVFDLSDKAFANYLGKFKSTKFDYINGYTSSIVQFAKYLKQKNVVLKEICPSLKVCVVTSEMLFEDDKKLMEKSFGIPVVNEYGASELDLIAFENTEGNWQVNSETLYVEIVDENDTVLPYGEEGRIIITSLFNKAHPFIRYDIGDIGVLDKKSTLKRPVLKSLTGRTNDIVHLPSGKKAAGLTFYYITKSVIEDDGNVKEFVIEQNKLDLFTIKYTSKVPLSKAQQAQIKKEIETYLESGLELRFERLDFLSRSKSGKLKQFTSLLNFSEV